MIRHYYDKDINTGTFFGIYCIWYVIDTHSALLSGLVIVILVVSLATNKEIYAAMGIIRY